ncbi:MAG TPA: hypothetical protein VIO56_02160 [Methylotenera sp.]
MSNNLLSLPADSALARLLARANVRQLDLPLEAVVCAQHGLTAKPDYPIAAIAAHADGLAVGDDYWLRADAVHLLLQRDSFSLSEPAPLQVEREHAELIIASLNQHFGQDGMTFCIGNSGAWYLRLKQMPEIQTTLPSVAMDRNIYQFMPQGAAASAWVSYLNEAQMLLHDHSVNIQRESKHQAAINSVWLSGGGFMPHPLSAENGIDFFVASSPFYHGLAQWSGLAVQQAEQPLSKISQHIGAHLHARLELPGQHVSDDVNFAMLWEALGAGKVEQLTLNLGCYEKTLVATIRPVDTYKFWRKSKPVGLYLK